MRKKRSRGGDLKPRMTHETEDMLEDRRAESHTAVRSKRDTTEVGKGQEGSHIVQSRAVKA